jgi:dTDP-4-dehydrorhamnose 3,5-epimerase-like enzyme
MSEKAIPWLLDMHADERGKLVVVEASRGVPFPIKRVFWIYDVPEGTGRGGHAHQFCQQLLVCVSGACRVIAAGDAFTLDDPSKALYVPPGVYLDLEDWQPGTVLLVLCSHYYDEEDYAYQFPGLEEVVRVAV